MPLALLRRLTGKRIGSVTSFHDVTERERLGRVILALEAEMPREVAENSPCIATTAGLVRMMWSRASRASLSVKR